MGRLGDYVQAIVPAWLTGPRSRAFLKAFGDVADELASDSAAALRAGRLEQCEDDALDAHAKNSALIRVRNELASSLRSYLRTRFDVWRGCGTDEGLIALLNRMGYGRAKVIAYVDLLIFQSGILGPFVLNPNVFGGNAGFFYIEIDTPNGFTAPARWDDGSVWEGGATWDLTEPYSGALEDLKAAIRRWKPSGTSCRFLRIRIGTEWITVPVGETWEYDADGYATDYYLTGV